MESKILEEVQALRRDVASLDARTQAEFDKLRADLAIITSRQNSTIKDTKKKPNGTLYLFSGL